MALTRNCVTFFFIFIFATLFDQYDSQIVVWPSARGGYFLPPQPSPLFPTYPFPAYPPRPGVGFPIFPAWIPNVPIDRNETVIPEDYSTDPVGKKRVVGGRNATEGELPYQVSIRTKFTKHNCGGTLIDKEWVITAAHCIQMASYITLGSIYVDHGGVTRKIAKSIKHPQYSPQERLNDIALIKMDSPVEFNDFIKPLPLPENDVQPDILLTLSGWGYTSYPNLVAPSILQVLKVSLIPNSDCSNRWKPYNIHPINICTESPKGKGSCKGDSGGPLMYNDELTGVVSFGAPCALGFPDVYTNVYLFKSWIKETIDANADLKLPFDRLD